MEGLEGEGQKLCADARESLRRSTVAVALSATIDGGGVEAVGEVLLLPTFLRRRRSDPVDRETVAPNRAFSVCSQDQ